MSEEIYEEPLAGGLTTADVSKCAKRHLISLQREYKRKFPSNTEAQVKKLDRGVLCEALGIPSRTAEFVVEIADEKLVVILPVKSESEADKIFKSFEKVVRNVEKQNVSLRGRDLLSAIMSPTVKAMMSLRKQIEDAGGLILSNADLKSTNSSRRAAYKTHRRKTPNIAEIALDYANARCVKSTIRSHMMRSFGYNIRPRVAPEALEAIIKAAQSGWTFNRLQNTLNFVIEALKTTGSAGTKPAVTVTLARWDVAARMTQQLDQNVLTTCVQSLLGGKN